MKQNKQAKEWEIYDSSNLLKINKKKVIKRGRLKILLI